MRSIPLFLRLQVSYTSLEVERHREIYREEREVCVREKSERERERARERESQRDRESFKPKVASIGTEFVEIFL